RRESQQVWDIETSRTLGSAGKSATLNLDGGLLIFFQTAAATLASANHIDPVESAAAEREMRCVFSQLENVKRHARDSEFAKQKKRLVAVGQRAVRDAATSTASSR
ncbi:unnamed protein product, partial [Prorocentrum cordatum]